MENKTREWRFVNPGELTPIENGKQRFINPGELTPEPEEVEKRPPLHERIVIAVKYIFTGNFPR